jgi:hypothetical protein
MDSEVLRDDATAFVLLVSNVQQKGTYYLVVRDLTQPGWSGMGNYSLFADFRTLAAPLFSVGGSLDAAHDEAFQVLTVNQSQLFHFDLSAQQGKGEGPGGVQMVIFDASNNVVFSTVALAGVTSRNDVWLAAGTYTVLFEAFGMLGHSVSPIRYTLQGYSASDAIGLEPVDTTLAPTDRAPRRAPPRPRAPTPPTRGRRRTRPWLLRWSRSSTRTIPPGGSERGADSASTRHGG